MVDFKKDTWIYALIAGILALIGILVPWASLESGGVTMYSWGAWFAVVDDTWGSLLTVAGATLWTFGLTAISAPTLLFHGIYSWKGMEFKWDWLFYAVIGILLIILPILAMVFESTTDAFPIGPIFIILAGVVSLVAFVIDKFLGGE